MKVNTLKAIITAAGCMLLLLPPTYAADVLPLIKDPNADGLAFGGIDAFANGAMGSDDGASFMGNDFLVQTTVGADCCNGAGISFPLSNGENGYTATFDGAANDAQNDDIDNATPADSVFTTIGNVVPAANPFPPNPVNGTANPRVGLNNGNVLRYSMWVREDPNNPITVAPQIEPVLKFEFIKEALSTNADNNGNGLATFGDRIWDTDQYEGNGLWIDIDNNGSVPDPLAPGDGRVRTITSTEWTQIVYEYTVDDSLWFGIDDDNYTVADVEEIRAVMFWGDFDGNQGESGSLWFDNVLLEVFADTASVTPIDNPDPALDEVLEDADFDNDGDVDGTDFLTWQANLGGDGSAGGDADFSGLVDGADLAIWQSNYDGAAALSAVGVPEPTSMVMMILGVAGLASVRRRA